MAKAATKQAPVSLTLVRRYRAPAEKVFRVWTDPAVMSQWFAPGAMTAKVTADARAGGRYRIEMREPDGKLHIVAGEYREVIPNQRLVKTWQWEGGSERSLVTVELREAAPGETEMTLTHDRFDTPSSRDEHQKGWNGCIAKIDDALARI